MDIPKQIMKNLIILLFIRYPYFRLDRKNIGHGRFANSPPPICKSARANSSIGAHQFFFVQKRLENCSWSKLNSPRSINKLTVVKLKFTLSSGICNPQVNNCGFLIRAGRRPAISSPVDCKSTGTEKSPCRNVLGNLFCPRGFVIPESNN